MYPALKYGQYEVKILTPTGYTHPKITTVTKISMSNGISRSSGSLNGHRLTLETNGFPSKVDKTPSVNLLCTDYSEYLPIISITPNKLTFETIKSNTDQACKLNITY